MFYPVLSHFLRFVYGIDGKGVFGRYDEKLIDFSLAFPSERMLGHLCTTPSVTSASTLMRIGGRSRRQVKPLSLS